MGLFLQLWVEINAEQNGTSGEFPEASLLLMGAALGAIGLYTGMKYFRHKTAHSKFVIGAPLLILVNVITVGFVYYAGHFKLNLF